MKCTLVQKKGVFSPLKTKPVRSSDPHFNYRSHTLNMKVCERCSKWGGELCLAFVLRGENTTTDTWVSL